MCFKSNLRAICFIIGYLHLIASLVDTVCHVVIVFITTKGFQCETDKDSLEALPWDRLIPPLVIINLGTHGFYPFPSIFNYYDRLELMVQHADQPRCFPRMLHLPILDVLYFLLNLIWLKFVLSFVGGVYKRNPRTIRSFFTVCIVKLGLQLLYSYQLNIKPNVAISAFKLADICVSLLFLLLIHMYATSLRNEIAREELLDKPPSYIECYYTGSLINDTRGSLSMKTKKKVDIPEEKEKEIEKIKIESNDDKENK